MAAKLYHTKRTPTVITATDSQPGYGPGNLVDESLLRPWRALDTGAKTIDVIFPTAVAVEFWMPYDVNFPTATFKYSTDGVAFSAGTVVSSYEGDERRRRMPIVVAQPVVKTLRLEIPNAASTDGLPFHRIGAQYPMGVLVNMLASEWAYQPNWRRAIVRTELANNQTTTATLGASGQEIALTYKRRNGEELQTLLYQAGAATVVWTPNVALYPEEVWPVYFPEERIARTRESVRQTSVQIMLKERV